jgi:tetratricopeptide (TPR) repeat protein
MADARQSAADLPDIDSLWDYNDPAASEGRFRTMLAKTEQSGQAVYRAELLTQIARTLSLRARFNEAHELLDEVEAALADAPRPRIRCLLERGRCFNSNREPARALPLFEAAWTLSLESGEQGLAVDAAHMVAIAAESAEDTLAWNLKALELAERSDQPAARRWLDSLYNNIGWTYHDDLKDYTLALEMFVRAVTWQREHGSAEKLRIARWCVARVLRSLGRVHEALAAQQALLAEAEANGTEPGYTLEEMGECLLALGKKDASRPFFARAHVALSQDMWLVRNEPDRLARLQRLSQRDDEA